MVENNFKKLKIAVIGGGVSGLGCAWCLAPRHDVTIYEKAPYFGGHARTVSVQDGNKNIFVDVGFIVYNQRNYPNLTALFDHLNVKTERSNMSFSVSDRSRDLEYEGSLSGFLTQPKNLFKRRYRRMLFDIIRFFREAENFLATPDTKMLSLGEYLRQQNYSDGFIFDHLLPMGASIWSARRKDMLSFPAKTFIEFFKNHALLEAGARPHWRTVSGGSINYVKKLLSNFDGSKKLNCSVEGISRDGDSIIVEEKSNRSRFDAVVFACHADEALSILGVQTTDLQHRILSAFRYAKNIGVLHHDPVIMPHRHRAWASWNFISERDIECEEIGHNNAACVTYWMNRLQNLKSSKDIFVSLNPIYEIEKSKIVNTFEYAHPQFDRQALIEQRNLSKIQGHGGLWFCGSYFGNGFHEDGLKAGLDVAAALGSPAPWWRTKVHFSTASSDYNQGTFKAS